jgi:hypothetical protein
MATTIYLIKHKNSDQYLRGTPYCHYLTKMDSAGMFNSPGRVSGFLLAINKLKAKKYLLQDLEVHQFTLNTHVIKEAHEIIPAKKLVELLGK